MNNDVVILWIITAVLIILLMLALKVARDLNIARRSQQETAALLRRLAEAMAPGSTKDVPISSEDDVETAKIPAPAARVEPKKDAPATAD